MWCIEVNDRAIPNNSVDMKCKNCKGYSAYASWCKIDRSFVNPDDIGCCKWITNKVKIPDHLKKKSRRKKFHDKPPKYPKIWRGDYLTKEEESCVERSKEAQSWLEWKYCDDFQHLLQSHYYTRKTICGKRRRYKIPSHVIDKFLLDLHNEGIVKRQEFHPKHKVREPWKPTKRTFIAEVIYDDNGLVKGYRYRRTIE